MLQAVFTRYRAAYAGLPREVWLMAFALFVNRCGTMVLPFLTLFLTRERSMSEGSAGLMISAFGLGSILGAYLGGRLVTRVGAVRVQTAALFLSAPCFLLIPLGTRWPTIAASLFLLGAIAEAVHPANAAAIALYTTPANRLRGFTLQRLAANLGFSFGPALGGILAAIDFQWLFVVDALTTLAAAILLTYFFRFRRFGQAEEATEPTPLSSIESPLKDRAFVAYLGLVLATSIVFFQFFTTYPLFLRDHYQFSKPMIGAMFAVNTTIIVCFEMLLVDAVKKWNLVRTIGWGCFLSCLGFGLLPYGFSVGYCLLAMFVITLGEMLSHPLSTGFAANRSPKGSEGLYMGWLSMMFSIAAVLGPLLGSLLYQIEPRLVWSASLTIGLLVLLGFRLLSGHIDSKERFHVEASVSDFQCATLPESVSESV